MILCVAVGMALAAQDGSVEAAERHLQKLRDRVAPSVVSIEVLRTKDPEGRGGGGPSGTHADYYNRPDGPCTGTVWTADGLIVTSAFNVSGEIRRITVRLHDGRSFEAKRLGHDRVQDVAILKIEAAGLPVLPRAKLTSLKQGDFVVIVGRAPDHDVPTLNQGILSATNRMNDRSVQTDAELNYGNAGGPLVTLRGDLIGVTCHVRPRTSWGQSGGVGFATKHTGIDRVTPELVEGKSIEKDQTPWMGISIAEGAEGLEGVPVAQVAPGSPAETAGFREGDVITDFDGKKVATADDLKKLVAARKIGDTVPVKVRRKDEKTGTDGIADLKVKLGENPE